MVVRLLVEDDPRQAERARRLLADAVERGERVLVTDVALCELEWVLDSAYRVPRDRILAAVQAICGDPRFEVQDRARIADSLDRYQKGRGDLSDYLLGRTARDEEAVTTFSFDRALRDDELFTAVP